ncbi:insulinase family protein [bacterium]|nr:insulinase family protein [candidate division CSSED10-310 bacterium]
MRTNGYCLLFCLLRLMIGVQVIAIDLPVTEHALPNGMKILAVEQSNAPVVSFALYYRVGSIDETPGKTGMAHYCEHMMFKTTRNLEGETFARLLGAVGGGHSNANTSMDRTCYHETVPPDRLELVIRLEAERMEHLQPTREEAARELEVVQEELRLNYIDTPRGLLRYELYQHAFDIHPYKTITIGRLEDVQSFTYEDLMDFQKKFYVPNNAVAVVVGNFQTPYLLDLMSEHFGSILPGRLPGRDYPEEPIQTIERRFVLDMPVQRELYMSGYKIPTGDHPDNLALRVLCAILSRGGSSPLGLLSQGSDPVAMYAYAYCRASRDPELLIIGAMPLPGIDIGTLEDRIDSELGKIRESGVTQEQLDTARIQLLAQDVYEMQSSMSIAFKLGEAQMVGSWRDALDLEDRLNELTPERIKEVTERYIIPASRTVGMVKNAGAGSDGRSGS